MRMFLALAVPTFGGRAALWVGPIAVHAAYERARPQALALGSVHGRVISAGVDVALACWLGRPVQLCGLVELELGRAQLVGHAGDQAGGAGGVDALFAASSLALAARLNGPWLALSLAARAGFARGPTARGGGREVSSFQGAFMGLNLSASVQP